MKSYNELITAGSPVNLPIAGRTFYLKESSGGEVLTVEFLKNRSESNKVENVGKGFKATPAASFDGIRISASIDSQVQFIVTDGDIEITFNTDAVTVGNGDASALPVRSVVGHPVEVTFSQQIVPLGSVTVDNTPAQAIPVTLHGSDDATSIPTTPYQAATVTDRAQVAVTDVRGVLIAAGATRRGLRIKNAGENPVAIGGVTLAFATAAVLIQPGETWNENEASGAAWYCVCGAALTSTLNIQDII